MSCFLPGLVSFSGSGRGQREVICSVRPGGCFCCCFVCYFYFYFIFFFFIFYLFIYFYLLSVTWGGQYGGLLEPPTGLGWSVRGGGGGVLEPRTGLGWSIALGEFCSLLVTWGGQYEGFLSPALAWGDLELGEFFVCSRWPGVVSMCLELGELFALCDLGWSVWGVLEPRTGLGWSRAGRALFLARVSFALGDLGWSVWGLLELRTGLGWSGTGRVLFALGDLGWSVCV